MIAALVHLGDRRKEEIEIAVNNSHVGRQGEHDRRENEHPQRSHNGELEEGSRVQRRFEFGLEVLVARLLS